MAAIIAHITRSNRERLEKKKYEIIISKCMYEIRPFERCFDAVVSLILIVDYVNFVNKLHKIWHDFIVN